MVWLNFTDDAILVATDRGWCDIVVLQNRSFHISGNSVTGLQRKIVVLHKGETTNKP